MRQDEDQAGSAARFTLLEPLRERTYRTIWITSVISNFGQLIQGVGAAWLMTKLSSSAQMVALVQTALMLPLMLVALPAGAIADMFDRRKIALTGLFFACVMAACLTALAWADLVSPWILLAFCFLIGSGVALYSPAWQASVGEQVRREHLPAAVALGTISYNVARSFGPAVGGVVVAALGAVAAFAANALFYLPLIIAFLRWDRKHAPSRLPPERIDRAIVSGVRYAFHSPPIRTVLIRTLVTGLAGASVAALTPLVAKQLLHGTASTYGLLLGAYGVGAVIGAMMLDAVRTRLAPEQAARMLAIITGAMIVITGSSDNIVLSFAALLIAGAAWMVLIAQFNVAVQLAAPRWVTARALACYGSAITGGIAIGAWLWGAAAGQWGVGPTMMLSGAVLAATPLLGLFLRLPIDVPTGLEESELAHQPLVNLALTPRSGPIIIELEYRVAVEQARDYYVAMQRLRSARLRSGAFGWTLSRDIADPQLWTEHYSCPTWGDYLRQRDRMTQADRELQGAADAFHIGSLDNRVRRRLERPTGSVRWRADTPDRHDENLGGLYHP
ncbi:MULTISPECIES: MFS transporter [unclassified Sphingobium]|uniref:MFS transporter n=1 Tax=unclassified Sphingobium TaxID=2611147 RepID=UPI000D1791CE|nr:MULTISPECIES: MFS transporter [unclassified Sphingobium]MBG6120088.1 MFS family permease [Sphingobium sp. JAI105]PSO12864.1 MFS transporter [Sphingobium sp. AEW4]TWD05711.1 putative MFS family arabinose efflux permease [Sphingobium sp. AEW010]TWD23264.1 putative MFS family arabinose efflux permease [Sphingobium sp. AEW013]TWD25124.1 putative MFS family arabinose efflux permease [Sphingobium sp. AEW001]